MWSSLLGDGRRDAGATSGGSRGIDKACRSRQIYHPHRALGVWGMGGRGAREYFLSTRSIFSSLESVPTATLTQYSQAALRTLAALCLFDNNHRRTLTDPNTLNLTSCLLLSLVHPYAGVRFAACQCVRVIGRAVSALRTNIVDSGLGMGVFAVFKREGEERDVCGAALAAVCNIVNEFSPLRSVSLFLLECEA